jgi:hypothetical protein
LGVREELLMSYRREVFVEQMPLVDRSWKLAVLLA